MEQAHNPNQQSFELLRQIFEDLGQELPADLQQVLDDAPSVLGPTGPMDEYVRSHLKYLLVNQKQTRQVIFKSTINLYEDWEFLRDCVALANSIVDLDEAVGDKGYIVLGVHGSGNTTNELFDPTGQPIKEVHGLLQAMCDQYIEPKVHVRYHILRVDQPSKKNFGLVIIEKASHRPVYLKEDGGIHWTAYVRIDSINPYTSIANREAVSNMFLRSQWPHLVAQVLDEDYRKRIYAISVLGSDSTRSLLSRDQYHLVSQLLIGLLLDPHIDVVAKAIDALLLYEPDERCNRTLIALCTPQVLMPICPLDGYDDSDTTEEDSSELQPDIQPTKKRPERLLRRLPKVLQKTASVDVVHELEIIRDAYTKSPEINDLSKNAITMMFNSAVTRIRSRNRSMEPEVVNTATNNASRRQLLDELDTRFDENECKDILFTMSMDYEDLSGETKRDRFRELIKWLERRDRLYELGEVCKKLRPQLDWISLTR